jgi:peptide/nickel transport system permease protein
MLSWWKHAARIVATILLGGLLGATLLRVAPGFGIDDEELDPRLSHASILALRQDQPGENLLSFYLHHLSRLVHGDLGVSRNFDRPVSQLLRERAPETLKLVGLGLLLGWTLAFALALLTVTARSWPLDLCSSVLSGILLCLPAALLALLFTLTRAPVRLLLALIIFPKVFRYSRSLLTRSAAMPHVLTARAKGLGQLRILFWHVLPTAAPQLLALAGVSVSLAFTAAIPVEALCDLPGIGQLAWKAALGRDLYLLVNLTMIVTTVTLLANSAADLLGHTLTVNPS